MCISDSTSEASAGYSSDAKIDELRRQRGALQNRLDDIAPDREPGQNSAKESGKG